MRLSLHSNICNMKTILVLAAVVAAALAASVLTEDDFVQEWNNFKEKYGKTYKDAVEESFRMSVYKENKEKVRKHNKRYEKGLVSFTAGLNKYSDLLSHEMVETMNGARRRSTRPNARALEVRTPLTSSLPSSVNWTAKGYVTAVKDQGQCGSCWSFSTTGGMEGQLYKKNGKLVSLSEQNLVDCATENDGCDGGWVEVALDYIKGNKGIDTEASYPYEGVDWNGCRYTKKHDAGYDTSYVAVASGNETALAEACANVGPISVLMDASLESFTYYSSGIYDDPKCLTDYLDHAVLVVGYGNNGTEDYWIVKNSWGTSWGEEGYFKLARNKNNTCGIATEADYPIV